MSADSSTVPGAGESQAPSLVGQILDGRYRIIRKLGEGGMGEVYAAEHVHIEKRFAIKLLRQEIVSHPEAVTRFRQEARSASSIGHRNIIAIEDFGQLADGRIYMCMELLNGAALNDLIVQPVGVDRLLNILIQTGHGLAAAHAKGIIHRDMKPENIFVTIGPSGEDVPKLLDFGIAKVSGHDGQNNLTRTGTIFGTPFYMAPEQALGNPVDERTDIYAVGVIMYECFSGSLPFQGDSFMGILTQHITMEPEPVAQRAAKAGRMMPPGLAEVITRCMQKNPAQRFARMDELVNVLIGMYRSMMGPGMSSYMEAFPVLPSSAHQIQQTPPGMHPPGMHATPPAGLPHPPHSGHAIAPSGQVAVSSPPSGMYPGASMAPPKSKTGLVLAIVAVLAVAGGVAAFVVTSGKRNGGTDGPGSGSQIASQGSQGATDRPDPWKTGAGSANPPDGSGAKDPKGSGSAGEPSDGAGAGSADGSADGAGDGSVAGSADSGSGATGSGDGAGSNAPPPSEVVLVPLFARAGVAFEVFENGVKLFDGPDNLEVPKGGKRTVLIKARGYKDKTVVVDGTSKKKVQFSLERIARPGPGPGGTQPEPTGPDCSHSIIDPKSKACIAQYCAKHPENESKCGLE